MKIQIPNSVGNRSVLPSSLSNKFSQSSSKLSGSFFNFVQGTSSLNKVEQPGDEIMKVESVTSVNSAEIEPVEEEIIQTESEKHKDNNSFGPDFIKLFSSPEKEILCRSASIFPPQELVPFLAVGSM